MRLLNSGCAGSAPASGFGPAEQTCTALQYFISIWQRDQGLNLSCKSQSLACFLYTIALRTGHKVRRPSSCPYREKAVLLAARMGFEPITNRGRLRPATAPHLPSAKRTQSFHSCLTCDNFAFFDRAGSDNQYSSISSAVRSLCLAIRERSFFSCSLFRSIVFLKAFQYASLYLGYRFKSATRCFAEAKGQPMQPRRVYPPLHDDTKRKSLLPRHRGTPRHPLLPNQ